MFYFMVTPNVQGLATWRIPCYVSLDWCWSKIWRWKYILKLGFIRKVGYVAEQCYIDEDIFGKPPW